MIMKKLSLKEIHECTIPVIEKIIEICDEIKVNYFVYYGSLIGAVRHKGFIPWDDDFDIVMSRPDYDIFVDYCKTNEKKLFPYKLTGRFNEKLYSYNICRFSDTRYKMIKERGINAGVGLFVDIYPFDGAGNDIKKSRKKIEWRKKFYSFGAVYSQGGEYKPAKQAGGRDIIKRVTYLIAKVVPTSFFINQLDDLKYMYSYEDSKYVDCLVWNDIFEPIKKEWLLEYIYVEFEGIQVKIPKEYDKILTATYGDYMHLPPEEQRKPQHGYNMYK